MEKTSIAVAITAGALVGFGLAGCSTPPTPGGGSPRAVPPGLQWQRCSTPQCDVAVTVQHCNDPSGIKPHPEGLEVDRGRDRKIRWEIVTAGYEFALGDIVIKTYDPKREFADPAAHRNQYTLKYRNSEPQGTQIYDYAITVRRVSDGRVCGPLDPWIRN